jgi:hypothetical protein
MNVLNMVRQWREQRDAIPTEKIKVLGLMGGLGSAGGRPTEADNSAREVGPIKPSASERAERRINMTGKAMLVGRHGKLGVEAATMQNVSSRGVRVISTSQWYTDDVILVSLPVGHFTSAARVAYCDALAQNRFAIGLEFVGSCAALDLSTFAPQ